MTLQVVEIIVWLILSSQQSNVFTLFLKYSYKKIQADKIKSLFSPSYTERVLSNAIVAKPDFKYLLFFFKYHGNNIMVKQN